MENSSEKELDSHFIIPTSKNLTWALFATNLCLMFLILGLAYFSFSAFENYLEPLVNFVLFFLGIGMALAWPISLLFDSKKLRPESGVRFTEEYFYVFSFFTKTKIKYSLIKKVVICPAVVNIKSKTPQRAWVMIQTESRKYFLVAPFYEELATGLEKRGIEVEVNRKALLIIVGTVVVVSFLTSGLAFSIAYLILAVRGTFSKNGFLTRQTELLGFLLGIGISMSFASAIPLSDSDQMMIAFSSSIRAGKKDITAKICEGFSVSDHAALLNRCAIFLSQSENQFKNYPKALQLGSAALGRSPASEIQRSAYSMACAYMGLGQPEEAVKLAAEHQLAEETQRFANGELCN